MSITRFCNLKASVNINVQIREKAKKSIFNGSICDQKSQLVVTRTELLNQRDKVIKNAKDIFHLHVRKIII